MYRHGVLHSTITITTTKKQDKTYFRVRITKSKTFIKLLPGHIIVTENVIKCV